MDKPGRTGQDMIGQGRAGQGRAGRLQNRRGQDRRGRDRTGGKEGNVMHEDRTEAVWRVEKKPDTHYTDTERG